MKYVKYISIILVAFLIACSDNSVVDPVGQSELSDNALISAIEKVR